MEALRCVDGSVLSVAAIACWDRTGQPYEITLELARNSMPFAAVGERCGYQLAQLADRVRAALRDPELAALWPDPADRFPGPARLHDYRPGESEYFTLRSRDRSDLAGSGELRCTLRSSADWIGECAGAGGRQAPRQRAWPGVVAASGQRHLPGQPAPGQPPSGQPPLGKLSPGRSAPGEHGAGELAPGQLSPGQLAPGQPDPAGFASAPIAVPGEPGGPGEPGRFRPDTAPPGCWRLTRRAVLEAWGGGNRSPGCPDFGRTSDILGYGS